MKRAPPSEADLVIIGAGLSGLTAAVAYAQQRPDQRVVLLESRPRAGGYVTTYVRAGWRLDTCQMVPDLGPILEMLGIELPLRRYRHCLNLVRVGRGGSEARRFAVPSDPEAFEDAVAARFPDDLAAFRRFLGEALTLYRQLGGLRLRPGLLDILGMFVTSPGIILHSGKTWRAWFQRFGIRDPLLLDVIGAFVEMGALPPERVSALVPISVLCSLLDGACRPPTSFEVLPAALLDRARALGVSFHRRARVVRVLLDRGAVAGVRLASGAEVRCRTVVSTIDPRVAMGELVGHEALETLDPDYARRVRSLEMSWSSFNLNLLLDEGLDLEAQGLDAGLSVLTTGGETLSELYRACAEGGHGFSEDRFHLGLVAPALHAGGKPYLTIRAAPAAMGAWSRLRRDDRPRYQAERDRVAALLEGIVERHLLPGLSAHVLRRDPSTPATYARYSGSPTGSIYDMAPTTSNFGRTRLPMLTPVHGLLQPSFVHGVYGAMLGGLQAVDWLCDGALMDGRGVP